MLGSWKLEALIIVGLNLATASARAQPDDATPPPNAPTVTRPGESMPSPAPPTTQVPPGPAVPPAPPAPPTIPREVYDVRLAVDIPLIVVGATAGLLRTYLGNHIVEQRCPCSVDEINSFDRHAVGNHSDAAGHASDITVGLALAVPPVLDLFVLGPNRAFGEDLIVVTEAVMVSTLFQQVANFGHQRPRPRTYEGIPADVHRGEGYLSFLAGHVATTTAVLTAASFTLRKRYGERIWPWIVTGVVGASVAAERLLGGYHFPSDIALGAGLGVGVGLAVPWLHAKHPEMQLAVTPGSSGYGLALTGQF